MEPTRIQLPGPIRANMTPLGLIMYSEWYLDAAKLMPVSSEQDFQPVRTYLACHSLELALKAFLTLKDHPIDLLAGGEFGHNLAVILRAAEQHGLSALVALKAPQKRQIRRASTYYDKKLFEYPPRRPWDKEQMGNAYPHRPDTGILITAAEALVDALYDPCFHAAAT